LDQSLKLSDYLKMRRTVETADRKLVERAEALKPQVLHLKSMKDRWDLLIKLAEEEEKCPK